MLRSGTKPLLVAQKILVENECKSSTLKAVRASACTACFIYCLLEPVPSTCEAIAQVVESLRFRQEADEAMSCGDSRSQAKDAHS